MICPLKCARDNLHFDDVAHYGKKSTILDVKSQTQDIVDPPPFLWVPNSIILARSGRPIILDSGHDFNLLKVS